MKKSHNSRAIIARLLLLGVLIIMSIFYFDSCAPLKLKRQTIAKVDKIVSEKTYFEEEIWCNNTSEGKQIFQLNHELSEVTYSSGAIEKNKKTDTLFVGIMSIDLPCPRNLSFSN